VTATLPTTATLAHNAASAGTEIHLPMSAIGLDPDNLPDEIVRMAAIATAEESPEAWAIFPTTNYLGTFTLTDHFTWGELESFAMIQTPRDWQPIATNLSLDVGIAPSDLEPIQDGSFITYTINYRNDGLEPVPWVQISVTSASADSMHGLSWLSWEHSDPGFDPTAADCTAGATTCMWWVGRSSELGEALAVSSTGVITLVGQVQMMPFTTLDAVTATILLHAINITQTLADSTPADNTVVSVHTADNEPPEVELGGTSVAESGMHAASASGGYVSPGTATVGGTASDPYPSGGEIASVEVSQDSTNWSPVDVWTSDGSNGYNWSWGWPLVDEEGVAHSFWFRARNAVGNVTASPEQVDIIVDTHVPQSSISSPSNGAIITGSTALIQGTASDGSGVAKVEVSTDGGATWHAASGTTSWSYTWNLESTGSYTLKSRATDVYDNVEEVGDGVRVTVSDVIYEIHLPVILRNHSGGSTPPPAGDHWIYLPVILK